MLHREQPFEGITAYGVLSQVVIHQIRPEVHVPAALEPFAAVMRRCWDADVEARPTARSVAEQVGEAFATSSVTG